MGRRRMKTNGDEKETRLAETTATYALGVFCLYFVKSVFRV